MKKRFLSLLLAICMILPCVFILNACGKCNHNWVLQDHPTLKSTGKLTCSADCDGTIELPTLNETDYVADVTNPDYKTYIYNIDGQSFKFVASNFVYWSHYVSLPDGGYGYDGLEILKYTGNSANVVIPDIMAVYEGGEPGYGGVYKEYPVTCITTNFANLEPYSAFQNNTTITSIVLPSTIKWITADPFKGCSNLKEIVLGAPEGSPTLLMEINAWAFEGCNNLKNIYFRGQKSEWEAIKIYNDAYSPLKNATVNYYSETQTCVADYIESDYTLNTWHYDENNNIDLWIKYTNNVENKSFTYSHSKVSFSDAYWAMLKEAENQGMLGDLFDNDQEQIEMVTSSATKAEYETKFATWYGTTMGTEAVTSFANGKATVTLMGNSIQTDYIEVNGEVWYTTSKEKAFTFDTANNSIYAEQSNDYYTIRHIYSIVE